MGSQISDGSSIENRERQIGISVVIAVGPDSHRSNAWKREARSYPSQHALTGRSVRAVLFVSYLSAKQETSRGKILKRKLNLETLMATLGAKNTTRRAQLQMLSNLSKNNVIDSRHK